MMHNHAVVWIDHHEAQVQSFTRDETERTFIKAHGKHRQVHHRKGSIGGAKAPQDQEFFAQVAHSLDGEHEVLVVGPAQAKDEFAKCLQQHLPELAKRVIGVETVDHPTDAQLLEHAWRFFKAADRMLP
jgi:stalled ribosome rescue protein Dom34